MPRIEKDIKIKNKQGLHARPAAMFVQIVSKYDSVVTVKKGEESINGKSIMGLLTLGVQLNSVLTIIAEGEDASKVVEELESLLTDETIE